MSVQLRDIRFKAETGKGAIGRIRGRLFMFAATAILIAGSGLQTANGANEPQLEPEVHVYATRGDHELRAHVFNPGPDPVGRKRPGIVIFHGGGWSLGSAEWGFSIARFFADRGMVAAVVEYRLSDEKETPPLDAMEDGRAAIRWFRSKADYFAMDPSRIAGYGWSAGAHIATSAAIFEETDDSGVRSSPDLLILRSAAVDLVEDEHIRAGLPPTILLQGRTDTVTPLEGAERFHDRMVEAGNECELHVYDGVGHLFTPSSEPDDGRSNPDPKVSAQAQTTMIEFMIRHGFLYRTPLETLVGWMTGSFSSEAQALADSSYFDIRLEMAQIWIEREDGPWLYVEQAASGALDRPYRQRVYQIRLQSNGAFESVVYAFPDPEPFIGAWQTPDSFDGFDPSTLLLREGCDVVMRKVSGDTVTGTTQGTECSSSLRGASYATSEVKITEDRVESWDRGFDAAGTQVWGATTGPYVFLKKSE